MARARTAREGLLRQVRATLREMKGERRSLDAEISLLERTERQLAGTKNGANGERPARARGTDGIPGEGLPPREKRAACRATILKTLAEQGEMTQAEASYRFGTTASRALLDLSNEPGSGVSPNGMGHWKRGPSPRFVWKDRETRALPGKGVEKGRLRT